MAQLIKKQSSLGNHTVYWTGGTNWSQDRSLAYAFANVDSAKAHMANPDGKNGGWTGATLETK